MIKLGVLDTGKGFAVCRIIDDNEGPVAAFLGPIWVEESTAIEFKEEMGELYQQTQEELLARTPFRTVRRDNRHTISYRTRMKVLVEQDECAWAHEVDQVALILTFLAGVYVRADIPSKDVVEGKQALAKSFV